MTRWKKDETRFTTSIAYVENKDGSKTASCRIPSPIINRLDTPQKITFEIKNKKIVVGGKSK